MKKVLVSLVAIFMVTGIVGCGNSKTAPGEENTQKAEETTKKVQRIKKTGSIILFLFPRVSGISGVLFPEALNRQQQIWEWNAV